MSTVSQKPHFTRRDFLKLALSSSAAVTLMPLLEACNRAQTATPIATAAPTLTPNTLTAGLEGLDIDTFLNESAKRIFLRDPEAVTINGMSALLGTHNDKLTDMSDDFIRETQYLQSGILEMLKQYNRTTFTPLQTFDANLYEWFLDDTVRGFPFMYDDYLVMPFLISLNQNLQYLFTEAQPLTNADDAQDFIARLQQMDTKVAQVLDALKRRQDFGVILPQILIPDLLEDLEQYTSSADSHLFYTVFSTKIGQIGSLSSTERQSLLDQAKQAIKDTVIPAYQSLIDYYNDVRSDAPADVGVWRYSNGSEYYAYLLRHFTTTELTPDEIHQLGLENVERVQGEMREALSQLGYPAGDNFASLMNRLADDSGYVSGEQGVAAYQSAIDLAMGMLDRVSDIPLKDKIVVVGGEAGNFFMSSPRDGSRPPMFYAVTDYPQPRYPIKDIAFHEAVPGHGYQAGVSRQLNLPLFREAISSDAYVEGWALYAERLMWELGIYKDDPAGNLGRLELELLRAVRCVVDTGIHAKKWTYDQAVQYVQKARGVRGEGEIRRFIMYPAQATSYYIGFLKILELRQRVKDKLGSQFDLREFHHAILGYGSMPLAMLEQMVDDYIAYRLKGAKGIHYEN